MEASNESFYRLKPACVALSHATLAFSPQRRNGTEVTTCLENLSRVIDTLSQKPGFLDQKLADYVFFPISQVLKASRDLPVRAMELCLQCLAVLISKGWRENVTPGLSSQLVIFLSLTCDTSGKTIAVSQVTDELRVAAFLCLSSLFEALHTSTDGKSSLTAATNIPSLGHAISVILDGVSDGDSFEVQSAAAGALLHLLSCIGDIEVLSSFFPGIVSIMTKVLTPSTQARRHWKITVSCLRILDRMILALLSDQVVASYVGASSSTAHAETAKGLSSNWVKATASQMKIALANVEKLRLHDRPEVRVSLAELNLNILADCSEALRNCCSLALETLLVLSEHDSSYDYTPKVRLEALVRSRPFIAETLASVFHDELLSLTRIMQSNDNQAKERTLRQVFSAYTMLSGADSDIRLLAQMLGRGLRDSVSAILQTSDRDLSKVSHNQMLVVTDVLEFGNVKEPLLFSAPLTRYKHQSSLLDCIDVQLKGLNNANHPFGISSELVSAIRSSKGDVQIAQFWLVLRDLQAADSTEDVLSSFLFLEEDSSRQTRSTREQLYAFAYEVMIDEDSDWRLKALSMETIAMQARYHKEEFRVELVDILYPILHHLGSEVSEVRSHAITCLNIVSDACGYSDVKDLIVSNVDYLVNAVALKLNAFDVSPQGPQVLLMMVRLAGPSLIPYLEDTLESIFAALEDYHGYPTLVALLFAVLKTIAEEAVISPQLRIAYDNQNKPSSGSAWSPTTMEELVMNVHRLANKLEDDQASSLPDQVPRRPWKEVDLNAEEASTEESDAHVEQDAEGADPPAVEPPPAPKTYAVLLKITELTQHYLAASSPSLRTSLLSLIRTTIPALAAHENSYLPLINTLWPEVTSRLFDDEPHIVSGSLQIISTMCEYAGVFMRTRISSLWPELVIIHRRVSQGVRAERGQPGSGAGQMTLRHTEVGYVDISSRAVWQSLLDLLKTVVKHVGIDADMFEEALTMLRPLRTLHPEVKAVLDDYNADAVWLAQYREGSCAVLERTKVESTGDWEFLELVV